MSPLGLSLRRAAEQFTPRETFLNTATFGLPPRPVSAALHAITDRWSSGDIRPTEFDEAVTAARAAFARMVGLSPAGVTVGAAASSLVGLVAASLPRGAEVLCADGDFTSLLFPFLERQEAGEIRVRSCPLEALADSVSERTNLIAVSAVQSFDGRACDFAGIHQASQHFGARVLLDATQALGWLPFTGRHFDYVVASGYKWLLSPRGTAFMGIAPELVASLRPNGPGWYAGHDIWDSIYGAPLRLAPCARRLDVSPAWFMWVGCAEALAFLERVGVPAIFEHNRALSATFLDRLGLPPSGSAIVSVAGPRIFEALAAAGIAASRRGGATRLSFHLYNTREQAITAADIIRRAR